MPLGGLLISQLSTQWENDLCDSKRNHVTPPPIHHPNKNPSRLFHGRNDKTHSHVTWPPTILTLAFNMTFASCARQEVSLRLLPGATRHLFLFGHVRGPCRGVYGPRVGNRLSDMEVILRAQIQRETARFHTWAMCGDLGKGYLF